MVRIRLWAWRDRREARRGRRRRLPDVLRRGPDPAPAGHGPGRARGGAISLRFRRHQGAVGVIPVAILAGGLGTRLGALTSTMPKALVAVAGRPFIDHQLGLLRDRGVERVV